MEARSWLLAAPLVAAGLTGACFSGGYLAGVPCSKNDECGPTLTCIEGVCDGPGDADTGALMSTGDDMTAGEVSTDEGGCDPGLVACAGACVDLESSAAHCGACGQPCAGECVAGECLLECGEGEAACGGACVDLESDFSNCGACGAACGADELCLGGSCLPACGVDEKLCGQSCVNLETSVEHCGGCFSECPPSANAQVSCLEAECVMTCDPYHVEIAESCAACGVKELLVDGPLHLWRLSEVDGVTAFDDIGGAHGTYVDTMLDQDGVALPDDRAALFGSTVDSHMHAEVLDFPSSSFTVEVVARIDELVEVPMFVSLSSGDDEWIDGEWIGRSNEFTLHSYSGDAEGQIKGLRLIIVRDFQWNTNVKVDDGAWHHIAVTWSNEETGKIRFYVDGEWAAATGEGFAAGEVITPGTMVLGQDQDLQGGGFDVNQRLVGAIDTVVIYEQVLSGARIKEHARALLCPS